MYLFDRAFRFIAGAMFAAFVMAAVGVSAANAQQLQVPSVSAFLANPEQLLTQHPNGGSLLTNTVQQLALLDPSTFKVLIGLVANANDLQKAAIGQGLAQAAKIEVLTNQALAAEWQQQIAAITDPSFKTAALNAFGDVQLGAVGGAAGGTSGLGGPGGGAGATGLQTIGQNGSGVPTSTSFSFTGGTSGSSGGVAGESARSVSPF